MRNASCIRWLAAGAFVVLWLGGIVSYLARGGPPPGAGWAAPAFLSAGAFLCLAGVAPRSRVPLVWVGAVGWVAEVVGVRSGLPFGRYHYTAALGTGLAGAPPAMAAAWLILVAYATHLFSALPGRRAIRTTVSALWLVLVDLVLDPVASGPLGFWRWEQPGAYFGVPTANFAGWFLVGLVAVRIVPDDGGASPWVLGTGLAVVGFFTVIAASRGLLLPGGVGLLLCVLHVAVRRAGSESRRC